MAQPTANAITASSHHNVWDEPWLFVHGELILDIIRSTNARQENVRPTMTLRWSGPRLSRAGRWHRVPVLFLVAVELLAGFRVICTDLAYLAAP